MNHLHIRTEPFANFHRSFTQSVLLAKIFRRGGMATIMELQDTAATLVQQVTGLGLESFVELPDQERISAVQNLSLDTLQKTQDVEESVSDVNAIAGTTLPYILHVFLITIFEAYLQDIAIAMCQSVPNLPKPKPGEPIRDFVDKKLRNKRMQEIGVVFNQNFHMDFQLVCSRINTSLDELDKAKVLRNIHVHNGGRVHKDFLKRVKEAGIEIEDYYPITIDYVSDLAQKIQMTVFGIDVIATTRYPQLPTTTVQFRASSSSDESEE